MTDKFKKNWFIGELKTDDVIINLFDNFISCVYFVTPIIGRHIKKISKIWSKRNTTPALLEESDCHILKGLLMT
ncbi:hypothetical protein BpHYR1_023029 [Brachionus plicatilis]|uniref:Uncharacterized protein n=1 Tax=Brachionus plicatilis TaxID=10195 RepID=A0A3M7T7M9_BRAPC|nr:hypothetical protein BpHYR1_023029 [Brachionus plicatilis]